MPTEDASSSGHLVRSHSEACMWSNVKANLSQTCLISELRVSNTSRIFYLLTILIPIPLNFSYLVLTGAAVTSKHVIKTTKDTPSDRQKFGLKILLFPVVLTLTALSQSRLVCCVLADASTRICNSRPPSNEINQFWSSPGYRLY